MNELNGALNSQEPSLGPGPESLSFKLRRYEIGPEDELPGGGKGDESLHS